MKKYIFGGLAMAMFLGVSSCSLQNDPISDYTEVTEGVTEEGSVTYFADETAVQSYITTMYAKFRDRQEHLYNYKMLISDVHSDNAYYGTADAEGMPFENNSIEGSNKTLRLDWDRYLDDIGYANILINKIDEVEMSTTNRESYRALGLVFRAYMFFDMVRIWGNIPCVTEVAEEITAENIEEVYGAYFPSQKNPVEVYTQIEADLLAAIPYLQNNTGDKTVFSKDVAYALLAKVYAEKPIQDYSKVIQYVDMLAADGFDLNPDYATIWSCDYADPSQPASETNAAVGYSNINTKESILESHCNNSATANWATWMFGNDEGDWDYNYSWAKWVTPSRDLIKAFTSQGDEVRYNQSVVWRTTKTDKSNGWSLYYPADNCAFMYKLRSKFNSFILMRYADLLLLKAEALIMTDNLPGAADIIDRVRARVGLGKLASNVRSNKEALLDAYLLERRLELAFEHQRWFDLVRLNKVEEVMNAVYAKDEGRLSQVYPYNETSYLLPIPQMAIDENENLVQNPGY